MLPTAFSLQQHPWRVEQDATLPLPLFPQLRQARVDVRLLLCVVLPSDAVVLNVVVGP